MRLIPMCDAHIPMLTRLEAICFVSPWTAEGFAEELENPQAHFLVAESDGEVCGYIGVQEICGEAYVTNVAVFPAYRRRGVGRALLERAARDAAARDCAFLSLEVRVSNAAAIRLYESCGFRLVGTRRNFYHDPAEDARIYTLFFEDTI